ncbi:MAG TPA: PAS domain S-box protein [Candidatus Aquabacterium excrementipullorum]|nr:PAS domain S-box protein [Candidatus Aquabacterium excrementipullorum]
MSDSSAHLDPVGPLDAPGVKALRDAEERHRQILNSATDYAVISLDLDGVVTSWNEGATRVLGWTEGEMLGQTVHRFFTPEDVADQRIERERAVALDKGFAQDESWRVRRDGTRFWASGQMTPLRNDQGQVIGFVKVLRDRTEWRNAQLRREILELATDAAEIGTWELDIVSDTLTWTDRTRAMFGISPGQPVAMEDFYACLHPDDLQATTEAFASALDPVLRSVYDVEYRTIGKEDGVVRWVAAKGKGIFDTAGRCLRAVGTAIDITSRKAAQARHAFLLSLADRIRLVSEPRAIMDTAVEAVCLHLGASRVGYWRVDEAEGEMTRETDYVVGVASLPEILPMGAVGAGVVDRLRLGHTAHYTDAATADENAGSSLADFLVRGLIAVPLVRSGVLVGAFSVCYREPRRWSRDDVALVEDVAARTWDAVERARAEEALREERHMLETLNRLGADLASDLELGTLVQRVVDAGTELTGAKFGAFFYNVLDEAGASYMLYALAGANVSDFDFGMPRNTKVFAPTFSGEGIVRSDDITKAPRHGQNPPHNGLPKGHLPVRSYLAVPVVSRSGEVIGGLFFGHPEVGVFTERSEPIMASLASQAAIAIDNARLFQDAQKAKETLEARVEERTRERDRVWDLSEDLLVIADPQGRPIRLSPSWTRLLGYAPEQLMRITPVELVHPDDQDMVLKALDHMRRNGRPVSLDNRLRAQDGHWRWISWTMAPEPGGTLIVGAGRDVTAEREHQAQLQETQEALRQSQKMEAVGQLTGGIAHDFNNLLQGITGAFSVIRRFVEQGRTHELDRPLNAGMNSANRAAALTHRLLAFSRRQPLAPKATQVNPLVLSMEDLLRRTLGESIRLQLSLTPELWTTLCDPNQLENAILNLCINARDAMPDGGLLTIQTHNVEIDSRQADRPLEVRPGAYVCIAVTDTGTGMSPSTLAKAFDPFFTTKPMGQGTGLGLSMIYGFARQSEGHARIDSELGKGTTVKLLLPRHLDEADLEVEVIEDTPAHEPGQGQTVLVIEDEPVVRQLVVELLHELGYRTLQADEGPGGLDLLMRHLPDVDLLVTDIGLPGLNGRQVADAARVRRPDLKVLFMTGYAETASISSGFLEQGMDMITKPFPMEMLAAKVRQMVGG